MDGLDYKERAWFYSSVCGVRTL